MKFSFWFSNLLFLAFTIFPETALSAISKLPNQVPFTQHAIGGRDSSVIEQSKFQKKTQKWKAKMERLKRRIGKLIQLSFPTGNLLASLVLLVISIVLLAVSSATTISVILNVLGSVAIIGAIIFFVLWLSKRADSIKPTD